MRVHSIILLERARREADEVKLQKDLSEWEKKKVWNFCKTGFKAARLCSYMFLTRTNARTWIIRNSNPWWIFRVTLLKLINMIWYCITLLSFMSLFLYKLAALSSFEFVMKNATSIRWARDEDVLGNLRNFLQLILRYEKDEIIVINVLNA